MTHVTYCTGSDSFTLEEHKEHGTGGYGYYQIRDNYQGKGYRLYYGGTRYVVQVDGEIIGRVFPTIKSAKAYCMRRFNESATRVF